MFFIIGLIGVRSSMDENTTLVDHSTFCTHCWKQKSECLCSSTLVAWSVSQKQLEDFKDIVSNYDGRVIYTVSGKNV